MRFWQNNRLDGTFEVPIEQIVTLFRASAWWTADMDLDSAVRGFLLDAEGPVSAVWDDGTTWPRCVPKRGPRVGPGERPSRKPLSPDHVGSPRGRCCCTAIRPGRARCTR